MEITLDKQSANQASVKIKLNEADYQPKVDAKLKEYARKATIKGFRPGKAPIGMIKKMYGTSVMVEEINDLLSKSLNDYLKSQTFRILGDPLPVIEDADKIEYLTNQNNLLKQKLKEAISKIKRLQGLEEAHAKNNGDLRIHIIKLEKQNRELKNVFPDIQEKG